MSDTYTYTDRDGDRLTIEPCGEREGTACLTTTSGAHVPAADLLKIVAELYVAAGQDPPIILPRRFPDAAWVTDEGHVRSLFASGEVMTPDSIRDLCSWYASAADLAEAEAERQRAEAERRQVEQLVALMDPWATVEANARAVLAAGYTRSES